MRSARLRAALDDQPSMVAQPALAELFRSGHLAAHVRRMRQTYADAPARLPGGGATPISTGWSRSSRRRAACIWSDGRRRASRAAATEALAALARRDGIVLSCLSEYDAVGDGPQGLMFGYAAAPENLVAPALQRLAEIWTQ